MGNITFHVGAPKTGTSSIQQFMFSNRGLLRDCGVVYPGPDSGPAWGSTINHNLVVFALTGQKGHLVGVDLGEARDIVDSAGGEHRVFSHESLYNLCHDIDPGYTRRLIGASNCRVVIYARRLDEWNESLYRQFIWSRIQPSQTVQHGKTIRPIEKTPHVVQMGKRTVSAVAASYREICDAEIVVRPYSAFRQGGLIEDFIDACGIDPAILKNAVTGDRLNEGRPEPATMLLWHLQQTDLPTASVYQVGQAALKLARSGQHPEGFEGRRFRFLPDGIARQAFDLYMGDVEAFPELSVDRNIAFTAESGGERELTPTDMKRLIEWISPELPQGMIEDVRGALLSAPAPV